MVERIPSVERQIKMDDKNISIGEPIDELKNGVDGRYAPGYSGSVPGINTPGIELPAFNPPVPNRAWTAMVKGESAANGKTSDTKKKKK